MLAKDLAKRQQLIQGARVAKDWQKTFGMSANDPGFDEMIRLGQEIRAQDQEDDSRDAGLGHRSSRRGQSWLSSRSGLAAET